MFFLCISSDFFITIFVPVHIVVLLILFTILNYMAVWSHIKLAIYQSCRDGIPVRVYLFMLFGIVYLSVFVHVVGDGISDCICSCYREWYISLYLFML